MDRLTGLMAFVRTADLGSFVAAARVLGLSPSAVGKAVTRLENQLETRLFQRSTRSLRLTEEGREFHSRCRRILDELDDAHEALLRTREVPRGRIKVSAPIITYHLLLPVLPNFMTRFPEIELDLDFADRIVDLIDEGVDVAIRSGQLPDSSFMVRKLRPFQMLLCASPSYLEKHGTPKGLRDLSNHIGVGFRYPNSGKVQDWPLSLPTGEPDVRIRHILTCNNMEALCGAVLRGLGIGCMPDFLAEPSLKTGALVPLLINYLDGPGQFHLIWPSSRHLSPKVRVFVDFIRTHLFSTGCQLPCAASSV
jgi:DNA-binding transcriptional LysR family regulator